MLFWQIEIYVYKKVLGKYIEYYNTEDEPNKGLEVFIENYEQLKLLTKEQYNFKVNEAVKLQNIRYS